VQRNCILASHARRIISAAAATAAAAAAGGGGSQRGSVLSAARINGMNEATGSRSL